MKQAYSPVSDKLAALADAFELQAQLARCSEFIPVELNAPGSISDTANVMSNLVRVHADVLAMNFLGDSASLEFSVEPDLVEVNRFIEKAELERDIYRAKFKRRQGRWQAEEY